MKKLKKILKEEIMKILENDEGDDPIAVLRQIVHDDNPSDFGKLLKLYEDNKENEIFVQYLNSYFDKIDFLKPNYEIFTELSDFRVDQIMSIYKLIQRQQEGEIIESLTEQNYILHYKVEKYSIEILENMKKDFKKLFNHIHYGNYIDDLYYGISEDLQDEVYTLAVSEFHDLYDDEEEEIDDENYEQDIDRLRDGIEDDILRNIEIIRQNWLNYYNLEYGF